MTIKDIHDKKIRIICPRIEENIYGEKIPLDIEGTILSVIGHSPRANVGISRNRYIKLIYDGDPDTLFLIRFDNDAKVIVASDCCLIRDVGVFKEYTSIWEDNMYIDEIMDRRPYHELRPSTHIPSKYKLSRKKYTIKHTYMDSPLQYPTAPAIDEDQFVVNLRNSDVDLVELAENITSVVF